MIRNTTKIATKAQDIYIILINLFIFNQHHNLPGTARSVLYGEAKGVGALLLEESAVLVVILERNFVLGHKLVIHNAAGRELGNAAAIGHAITL
jgi:hypothetical protein